MEEEKKTYKGRAGRSFTSGGMIMSGAAITLIVIGVFITAVGMLVYGILAGSPPTSDHDKKEPVNKNENVTVETDMYGNATSVSDVVYITNNPEHKVLRDESILTKVTNKKQSANLPSRNEQENVLIWSAKGYDVSYEGSADPSKLPITMSVKYYLNDKEIDAEDLIGKSGNLKVVVNYHNNIKATLDDGTEIVVPYVAATMLISSSDFSKIKCTTGKSINISGNEIAMGVNVPGLSDLSGSKLFGVGTCETIFTGKIANFQGAQIKSVVTGDIVSQFDSGKLGDLNVDALVVKLASAANTAINKSDQFMPYLDIASQYIPKVMDVSGKARSTTNKVTEKLVEFFKQLDTNYNTVDGVANIYQSFIDKMYKELYGDIDTESQDELQSNEDSGAKPIDETLDKMGNAIEGYDKGEGDSKEHVDGVVDELGQTLELLKKAEDAATSKTDKEQYDKQIKDICGSIIELDPDSLYLEGYEDYLTEDQKQIRSNNNDGEGGVIDEYNDSRSILDKYEKIYKDPSFVSQYFTDRRQELQASIAQETDATKKAKLQKQLDNLNIYEAKAKKEDGTYYSLEELDKRGADAKEVISYIIESNITPEQKDAIIAKLENANGFVNKIDNMVQKYGNQAPGIIKKIKQLKKKIDAIYYRDFLKYMGIYSSELKGTTKALEKTIEGHKKVANFSGLTSGWTGSTNYTFTVPIGKDNDVVEMIKSEVTKNGNK